MKLAESPSTPTKAEVHQKLFDLVKEGEHLKSKDADGYEYTIVRHMDTQIVTISVVRDARSGQPTRGYDFNINPHSETLYLDADGQQSKISDEWLEKLDSQDFKIA